ncbi:hypothetical protein G6011_00807 [Alternaria panax]|uniref:Uncharacterized protein n=1 Tax=Alternaria panax TaxID=48097 RepID=A0AAD4IIS3_9PLEO|nr:hypothetical protein G6011_00807 [Alternaria panax]
MFTASLFGMNVDIFKDNPDWRWFFLAGGICLVSTISAWLIFKYYRIMDRDRGKTKDTARYECFRTSSF